MYFLYHLYSCTLQVQRDGALQLYNFFDDANPSGVPFTPGLLHNVGPQMLAPYWCDSSNGVITFGIVERGDVGADALLQKADSCVKKAFPLIATGFESNALFVATWTNVRATGGGPQV